jgi:hypothetical protein
VGGDRCEAGRWLTEGTALFRRLNRPIGIARALRAQARLEADLCRWDAARALCREAAGLAADLGDYLGIAETLEGLARVDAAEGRRARAARRLDAASHLRAAIEAPLPPVERPSHECLREQIGDPPGDTPSRRRRWPWKTLVREVLCD